MSAEPKKGLVARLAGALDDRFGHRELFRRAADERVPGGARWAYVFGSALLAAVVVQAVTGYLLMTAYAPSALTAWASVHYITFTMSCGWIVRGLHHWGSGVTVVLLAAHLAQTALFGAYKKPREMNWWFGLVLMGIVLGFSLTGYLLPWDQKGYWATRVATNIAGTIPLVGGAVQRLAQGGNAYGHLTLTRFYALHVGVLPMLLVLLVTAHLYLFRRHGVTPPAKHDPKKVDLFYPKQLALDVVASVAVVGVTFALTWKNHGGPLDAPADAASDYPARPEWYFLSLFQMLKYFHGPLEVVGTLVVPSLAVTFLFALPLLDRKPGTAIGGRKTWVGCVALGFAGICALTLLSLRADARDEAFKKARRVADERAAYANEIARRGVPPDGPLSMLDRDPELRGAAIWKKECATCHSIDGGDGGDGGNGGSRGAKTNAADLKAWGTAAWAESMVRDPDSPLRFGRTALNGQMPSMTKPTKPDIPPMKEEDVKLVVAFVAGSEPKTDPRGKEVFENACGDCHRMSGTRARGDDNDYAPDLTGWGSYRWLRAQIANPASGSTYKPEASKPDMKGHMPAFELDPDVKADIDVIARWVYVRATGHPPTDAETAAAAASSGSPESAASSGGTAAPAPKRE